MSVYNFYGLVIHVSFDETTGEGMFFIGLKDGKSIGKATLRVSKEELFAYAATEALEHLPPLIAEMIRAGGEVIFEEV